MKPDHGRELPRLARLAEEIRLELDIATRTGRADRCDALRAELALLDDLLLPEAASQLRLQRITYDATREAMSRPLPPGLVEFLA